MSNPNRTADALTVTRFWLHLSRPHNGARVLLSDGSQICVRSIEQGTGLDYRVAVCEPLIGELAPWLGDAIERGGSDHVRFAGWDDSREDAERKADASWGEAA